MEEAQQQQVELPLPNENRRIDSPVCCVCVLLILALIAYFLFAAILNATPFEVGRPLDPDGRACGFSEGVEDYPFMYFTTPYQNYIYRAVCVSKCPSDSSQTLFCKPNRLIRSCENNPSLDNISNQVLVYPSIGYKSWTCLPLLPAYFTRIKEVLQPTFFQSMIIDAQELWVLLLIVYLSLTLCTYLVVKATEIRYFPLILLISTFLLSMGLGVAGLVITLARKNESDQFQQTGVEQAFIHRWIEIYDPYVGMSIAALAFLVLLGIVTAIAGCLNSSRLTLISTYFVALQDYYSKSWSILLAALFLQILGTFLTGGWILLYVLLQSLIEINLDPMRVPTQAKAPSADSAVLLIMIVFYLFIMNTFDIICRFFFMGSVAEYIVRKDNEQYSPTIVPLTRMVYHIGGFLKGGLFLTIFAPFLFLQELIQIFFVKSCPKALQDCTEFLLLFVSRESPLVMYIYGEEFSVSSVKINQLMGDDHHFVRGAITFFRWLMMVFALVLSLTVFGVISIIGDWQTTSSLNCFILVGIAAYMPTLVMISLVIDGALSLYLCNLISPRDAKYLINHKQFLE